MMSSTAEPQVTVVVVPRERFSSSRESLESIYEHSDLPFKLIYVDGNSPGKLRRYLEAQAKLQKFQLIQTDYYLSPNQAKNLALPQIKTKYVVFVDNDVVVAPGWLQPLVECAEQTAAAVVSSLVCQNLPLHEVIHCAGGEYMLAEALASFLGEKSEISSNPQPGKRQVAEKIYLQGKRLVDLQDQLKRQQTGFVEYHSFLVRMDLFQQIGLFDEKMLNTKDHIDFCMTVARARGSIYLEPASVVTFLNHPPAPALEWSDLPYFMLRWSDAWELATLHHFRDKWNLTEDNYFQKRYKEIGWRRKYLFIRPPLIAHIYPVLGKQKTVWIEKKIVRVDRILNRYLTTRYTRKRQYRSSPLPQQSLAKV